MNRRTLLKNPLVMVVFGVGVGLFLGIGLGAGLLLVLSGAPKSFNAPVAAADYDIEAVVDEAYINRILVDNANTMTGPLALTAGELDLKPGGIGDFRVALDIALLSLVVDGRVGFRPTADGSSIEVVLLDVQVGGLQLSRLLPNGLMDDVNADIERLLIDKIGARGLKVIGLETGDEQLRLQFGRE